VTRARIGTAGWSIPRDLAEGFPEAGSGLQRYAARLGVAEINSTFHRPHRPATYERWASEAPDGFRFSVKMRRTITHDQRLAGTEALVEAFLAELAGLGDKAAVLLVQLPPSLQFEAAVARAFFAHLRDRTSLALACEPRHPSWLEQEADALLADMEVARVAADPDKPPGARLPGGWNGLRYFRLHGSPVPYRSSYEEDRLADYARQIAAELALGRPVWCIFDNTASSAATGNAIRLGELLTSR
jgi:uncharacterized protein YecE (DUF72 family)